MTFNLLSCSQESEKIFLRIFLFLFSFTSHPLFILIIKLNSFLFFSFLYLQFKELTYGLQKTNASTLLRSCLEYVMSHYDQFLPGEAGNLLDLTQNVSTKQREMMKKKRQKLLLLTFIAHWVCISTSHGSCTSFFYGKYFGSFSCLLFYSS